MREQDFLLYWLDTGENPACPSCGVAMQLVAAEVRDREPGFLTFQCTRCSRCVRGIHND
jgi:hypothetical protein